MGAGVDRHVMHLEVRTRTPGTATSTAMPAAMINAAARAETQARTGIRTREPELAPREAGERACPREKAGQDRDLEEGIRVRWLEPSRDEVARRDRNEQPNQRSVGHAPLDTLSTSGGCLL